MKNEEIEEKLSRLSSQSYSLEDFDNQLQRIKEELVSANDQQGAKQIWIYQTIIEIHKLYCNAFNLLRTKKYYEAWCQLERIEITLSSLKRHFTFDKVLFNLWHIEKCVKNLQVIYPYRIFF